MTNEKFEESKSYLTKKLKDLGVERECLKEEYHKILRQQDYQTKNEDLLALKVKLKMNFLAIKKTKMKLDNLESTFEIELDMI